jgi:hypothetical protein
MFMVGSSIWRRSDGREGLIIFGSRRRQTAANGGTVHLSLRTNVITAAKARTKLFQPILDGGLVQESTPRTEIRISRSENFWEMTSCPRI